MCSQHSIQYNNAARLPCRILVGVVSSDKLRFTGYKFHMVFPLLILAFQDTAAFEPSSSYKETSIEGFQLKISKDAVEAPEELEPAMALLELRIREIVRRVPVKSLETLRKIPIWIERKSSKFPCMCYHESAQWLKENGLNPEKAKGVELANLKNFVLWSFDQPLMVLHEYAHGYHDLKFGFGGEPVKSAFDLAMKSKLYDSVSYYRGQKRKAYAATNPMEYFAELSEALFGYNDYYPFTSPELAEHDPRGFAMVKAAWGVD